MSILITGANGFVGNVLLKNFLENNIEVKALSTKPIKSLGKLSYKLSPNCDTLCEDANFLRDVTCIVHLAGLAHRKGGSQPSKEDYMQVNYHYPLKLARLALYNGVKRFIFVSTIGVNGNSNESSFDYQSPLLPDGDYATSKHLAEQELTKFTKDTELELVIIRPPLVYGKGAPGNFGSLLRVVQKNLLLPLGSINNCRSFVYVENLVSLITRCIDHPKAVSKVLLVSDDCDISTSDLLLKMIKVSGHKNRLIPFPLTILKLLATIIGKKNLVEQLSSSLTVNIEYTKSTLNWNPPISLDEGIRRCFK